MENIKLLFFVILIAVSCFPSNAKRWKLFQSSPPPPPAHVIMVIAYPPPTDPFLFSQPFSPYSRLMDVERMNATCGMINTNNELFKSIPYSGFFDHFCRIAKAFMPTSKDIEAVARQAEPEATSLQLPRLKRLRERMRQRARALEAEVKASRSKASSSSSSSSAKTPKLTRKLRWIRGRIGSIPQYY